MSKTLGQVIAEQQADIADLKENYTLACEILDMLVSSAVNLIDIAKDAARLTAERDRLSALADKWNLECDETREDNKRLAAELKSLRDSGVELPEQTLIGMEEVNFSEFEARYGYTETQLRDYGDRRAAAERERCAKVCAGLWRVDGQFTADEFAEAIRKENEMKIKTSELTGAALDWAVAECEGVRLSALQPHGKLEIHFSVAGGCNVYSPSTDWAQGGPIIEREGIALGPYGGDYWAQVGLITQYGPTPLIAAMRCLVASKLGDEVEVPGELI